jgi:hypothetical protein
VVNVPAPEQTYYLRVKTRSRVSLQVDGLEPGQADRKDHQRDLLEVFFITSMGFLLIWAIHAFHLDRQPVVGWFAVHQAAYTLFGVAATGYMAPLNPTKFPHLVDWINATLYLTINFTCAMFCRALFGRYDPPPLVRRVLDLLPWVFPVLLAALAAGYDSLAVNISAAILKLSLVFFSSLPSLCGENMYRRDESCRHFSSPSLFTTCCSGTPPGLPNWSGAITCVPYMLWSLMV